MDKITCLFKFFLPWTGFRLAVLWVSSSIPEEAAFQQHLLEYSNLYSTWTSSVLKIIFILTIDISQDHYHFWITSSVPHFGLHGWKVLKNVIRCRRCFWRWITSRRESILVDKLTYLSIQCVLREVVTSLQMMDLFPPIKRYFKVKYDIMTLLVFTRMMHSMSNHTALGMMLRATLFSQASWTAYKHTM